MFSSLFSVIARIILVPKVLLFVEKISYINFLTSFNLLLFCLSR